MGRDMPSQRALNQEERTSSRASPKGPAVSPRVAEENPLPPHVSQESCLPSITEYGRSSHQKGPAVRKYIWDKEGLLKVRAAKIAEGVESPPPPPGLTVRGDANGGTVNHQDCGPRGSEGHASPPSRQPLRLSPRGSALLVLLRKTLRTPRTPDKREPSANSGPGRNPRVMRGWPARSPGLCSPRSFSKTPGTCQPPQQLSHRSGGEAGPGHRKGTGCRGGTGEDGVKTKKGGKERKKTKAKDQKKGN